MRFFGFLFSVVAAAQSVPRPAPALNILAPCKGRPTLLAFVVTDCPHCQAFTRQVMEPLSEAGRVCALAVAFNEEADTGRFAAEQHLTFPVYKIDRTAVLSFLGLTGYHRALGTPQVVVIDKAGMIQAQSAALGTALLLQLRTIQDIIARLR